jgi:hypothetical protein
MKRVKVKVEFDLTEWVEDSLVGWSVEERTRWEGEGGFIPGKRPEELLWWQ